MGTSERHRKKQLKNNYKLQGTQLYIGKKSKILLTTVKNEG